VDKPRFVGSNHLLRALSTNQNLATEGLATFVLFVPFVVNFSLPRSAWERVPCSTSTRTLFESSLHSHAQRGNDGNLATFVPFVVNPH